MNIVIDSLFKNPSNVTLYVIAKLFNYLEGPFYKCTSIDFKTFYRFKNHRWQQITTSPIDTSTIEIIIMNRLVKEFTNHHLYITDLYLSDKYSFEQFAEESRNFYDIIKKISDNEFQFRIVEELAYLLYDSFFVDKLDSNKNLLAFENGVYDLEKNIFRNGEPNDFINLSMGYDYIEYDTKNPVIIEIHNFFDQYSPVHKDYLLKILASYLTDTHDQSFFILCGNTAPLISYLLLRTLGDCARTTGTQYLNDEYGIEILKDMNDLRGVRLCRYNINENTDISSGCIYQDPFKEIFDRVDSVYPNFSTSKPQFKRLVSCNDLKMIRITNINYGTVRRVILVPTNNILSDEFCNILTQRFTEFKQCFMSILIQYHTRYVKNGLVTPQAIIAYTKKYYETKRV